MAHVSGKQHQLATFPASASVADLSDDARYVLVTMPSSGRTRVKVLDTVSRRSTHTFLVSDDANLRFTNPSGRALLSSTATSKRWRCVA